MTDQVKIPNLAYASITGAFELLPPQMETDAAWLMLLAIGLQESKFRHTRQVIQTSRGLEAIGPATSWWQFEKGGGCRAVLSHPASRYWAHQLCKARQAEPRVAIVWKAMENDPILAAGFARLLLFTDPKPLPKIGDQAEAWNYYRRNWRPGKPHPETWPGHYFTALEGLEGVSTAASM